MDPEPDVRRPGAAHRTAAVATLLEALVLLGFLGFWVYEMAAGASDDMARAAASAALILVFGTLLLVLARGWARARDWARTPTLLWNALLLPVAWSLHDSGRTLIALAVLAVALVSLGAALAAPPRHAQRRVS